MEILIDDKSNNKKVQIEKLFDKEILAKKEKIEKSKKKL
jgi:hypothetical protein